MRGQIPSSFSPLLPLRSRTFPFNSCCLLFALSLNCTQALAVPPITPSGLHTTISDAISTPEGTQYNITGGVRPGGGGNLFHSFGKFDIPTNSTANLQNMGSFDLAGNPLATGLPTTNILARVTGGNPSNIFGTINTTDFGNANLFLINPAGILLGPNAAVDVGGLVSFTTADYLRLTDAKFNAIPNTLADGLLTAMPVVAFGFLGPNAAAITVQGSTLRFAEGQTLSLIGGNRPFAIATETPAGEFVPSGVTSPPGVTVTGGTLVSPSGRIYVGSVDSAGEIILNPSGHQAGLDLSSFSKLGLVELLDGTKVDVSTHLDTAFNPISDLGNGSVHIRGGKFVMSDATITSFNHGTLPGEPTAVSIAMHGDVTLRNSSIQTSTVNTPGGIISLTAHAIEIEGSDLSSIGNGTEKNGDIKITTMGSFSMNDRSLITSDALFGGNGGTIDISAGSLSLKGGTIRTTSEDLGATGKLDIRVDTNLTVTEGGRIQSTGSLGPSGNISITAGDTVTLSGTGAFDSSTSSKIESVNSFSGPSGTVTIQSEKFILGGNALVETGSITQGGGAITIHANDSVTLANGSRVRMFIVDAPGGMVNIAADNSITIDQASIRARTGGIGDAGAIILTANNITVTNGQIASDSAGQGRGGDVTITAAGQFSTTGKFTDELGQTGPAGLTAHAFGSGNGGDITLTAGQSVTIQDGASVSASSTGLGNAGNILIDAGQQLDLIGTSTNKSSITTEATQASGGNIDVRAIDRIRLVNSTISTSVLGAEGNGGNIFIDPKVVVLEGSTVTAKAVGGSGGNITFVTPLFLKDLASDVNASSQRGASGTVTIQSPTSNLSGTVGQLASKTSPPQMFLHNRCIALAGGGGQSTFILTGHDTLPAEPGGWLSSPVTMEHWTLENTEEHASELMVKHIEPNPSRALIASEDQSQILSIRRLTPQGFLVRSFATPSTGCPS